MTYQNKIYSVVLIEISTGYKTKWFKKISGQGQFPQQSG